MLDKMSPSFFLAVTIEFNLLSVSADTLKVASDKHLAVMIAKGIDSFPENTDRMSGTIDVWWIVRILAGFMCAAV